MGGFFSRSALAVSRDSLEIVLFWTAPWHMLDRIALEGEV